jgi:hypothetical protein
MAALQPRFRGDEPRPEAKSGADQEEGIPKRSR